MKTDIAAAWWPVALVAELRSDQPLGRRLHGLPIVLFRNALGVPVALQDRCPHRHAPLSAGKVCEGTLSCPYHGWRFAGDGRCISVPGLGAGRTWGADSENRAAEVDVQPTIPKSDRLPERLESRSPLVPTLAVQEAHGLLWVCAHDATGAAPPVPAAVEQGVDVFFMTDTVRCGLAQAAENFLDGFHTHFVHAGWVRRDQDRQSVRASVRRLPDGIEARYSGEGLQSGVLSRWLEGSRSESMGRFRWPGVAEIEYRSARGLNLLVTAWLTPEDSQRVRVHARVATRRGLWPAWAKRLVLSRLFAVILKQDRRILERTSANAQAFAALGELTAELSTPLDLLGPSIHRLLAREPLDASVECDRVLRL